MKANKEKNQYKTMDEYFETVENEKFRTALEKPRRTIRSTAPKATEVISYQIPVYKYSGMLVGFAAYKKHCSFFVMGRGLMKEFEAELKNYEKAAATIHFTPEKPPPASLVKKIVKARMIQNESRTKSKQKS
ncbi:MAG TPA: DUF1801 domain-containing protein [Ignavibacteria bacterium]